MHSCPRLTGQTNSSLLFLQKIREVASTNNYRAVEGSSIANDAQQTHHCEAIWQGELYEQSDVQAEMALLAALQNMSLAMEDAGRRPAAFMVLLRATLEAAASAHYLSSPARDAISERARRGFNEMLFACFQQWKALKDYGQLGDANYKLQRMNEWLDKADSYPDLGTIVRAHERPRPKAPYVGRERPTITSRLNDLFPSLDGRKLGRWLYAAISAPSHHEAHGYAIAAGQILDVNGTQRLNPEGQMTEDRVARFSITCLTAIYQAVVSVFTRYGWPWDAIETQCNVALSEWQKALSP